MESQKGELDTKLLSTFLQRNYRDDKPITLIDTEIISGSRIGDNFGSVVFCVKMKFICGSGKIKRRSMIVKTERNWNEQQEFMKAFPIFRNEIKMYSTIFSLMEDLMEEFDDKRDKLWPIMYGYLPYNLIALENLRQSQFEVADRKEPMDLKHATLVLRSLARFHAMSKVLIEKGLITKEDKNVYPHVEEGGVIDKMWSYLLSVFSDGIRDEWGEEWSEMSEKLKKSADRAVWNFQDLANNYDKRFEVISHGDAWHCNMMFRYLEHENIPIALKFVDFQMSFASSFIWDLSHFMVTSITPSVRRQTDQLLGIYCDAFSENLKFFDYADYIPTLGDAKMEWKRLRFTHLVYFGIHVMLSSGIQGVFDPSKIMTHSPYDVYNVKAFSSIRAKEAVGDDLKHYHGEGVF